MKTNRWKDPLSRTRPSASGAVVWAVAAALAVVSAACAGQVSDPASSGRPWAQDTVAPADLVKELAGAAGPDKPVVICTAPPFLYRLGRIPGAVLHGPAADSGAVSRLKEWARPLPRSTSLVIYCGCCPIGQCPNLDPAYVALKELGFTRVRALFLPDSFGTDWVEHGYPVER